jgi:hypothetical protein
VRAKKCTLTPVFSIHVDRKSFTDDFLLANICAVMRNLPLPLPTHRIGHAIFQIQRGK